MKPDHVIASRLLMFQEHAPSPFRRDPTEHIILPPTRSPLWIQRRRDMTSTVSKHCSDRAISTVFHFCESDLCLIRRGLFPSLIAFQKCTLQPNCRQISVPDRFPPNFIISCDVETYDCPSSLEKQGGNNRSCIRRCLFVCVGRRGNLREASEARDRSMW